jgi:hypothetical protein
MYSSLYRMLSNKTRGKNSRSHFPYLILFASLTRFMNQGIKTVSVSKNSSLKTSGKRVILEAIDFKILQHGIHCIPHGDNALKFPILYNR